MFTLGTRGSDLALWQARHVRALFNRRLNVEVEIQVIKTAGDQDQQSSLNSMPGKGFFTKEIEVALLEGHIDLAVHSHKDLPTESPAGLSVVAVPERGPVEECLLVRPEAWSEDTWMPLRRGAVVGTGSARRASQLLDARPDLEIRDLRGNVPTRVRKVVEGRYDAIVLARAGLERLELDIDPLRVCTFSPDIFVPAPAQGALGIQMRADDACRPLDTELRNLLAKLHDDSTGRAVATERLLLAALEGGCNLPLGAWARPDGDRMEMHAALGTDGGKVCRCFVSGRTPLETAEAARIELIPGNTGG